MTSGSLCDYFHYLLIIFVINLLIAYEIKKKKKVKAKGEKKKDVSVFKYTWTSRNGGGLKNIQRNPFLNL